MDMQSIKSSETINGHASSDGPQHKPKQPRRKTPKWVGVAAVVVATIAVVLTIQFQRRPAEGTGGEIYKPDFVKGHVAAVNASKYSHTRREELNMIHKSFDWAVAQLNANGVKVGQGNFGNAMFNFMHDESYQKCEEQNAQFMHLSAFYLNMSAYKLSHYKIGLAFDSKWIIEDMLPLKKHVWGIVVDSKAANSPMPVDSRSVTEGIIDPWKGHTRLQDPTTYTGFAGVEWVPESIEFITPTGGSTYWED